MGTKRDNQKIATSDMNELRYYSKKFKCTIAELLTVIKEVGNDVATVRKQFKKYMP